MKARGKCHKYRVFLINKRSLSYILSCAICLKYNPGKIYTSWCTRDTSIQKAHHPTCTISILYDVGHREGRKKNLGGWRFDDARFKRPIINSAALRRGFPRLGWSRQVAPVSTPARCVQAAERPARFLYKKNSEVAFGRYRATLASGILEQGQ